MADRYVIGLEVVVHGDLPVALPVLEVAGTEGLHFLEAMRRELRGHARPDLLQRPWVAREAYEDEAEGDAHAHGLECQLRAIERRESLACGDRAQLPAQAIRPAVIGAGDRARAIAGALEDARATVSADVVEGADLPLGIPHHDDAVGTEVERHVIPGCGDGAHVTDDLPARLDEPLVFAARQLRVVVDPGRQGARRGARRGFSGPGGGRFHGAFRPRHTVI